MKKYPLITLLLLCSIQLAAQMQYYIETNANFSLISGSRSVSSKEVESDKPNHTMYYSESYMANYKNRPGINLQGGFNYITEDKLSFDLGIRLSNNNFIQELRTKQGYFYVKDGEAGTIDSNREPILNKKEDAHSLFLIGLPLGLSYYLLEDQLAVGIGITPSLVALGTGGDRKSRDFNKTAVAMHVQLRYSPLKDWWFTGGFYDYSTKLYQPEKKQSFSNLREINIGVRKSW